MIKSGKILRLISVLICSASLLSGCGSIGLAQESTFESAFENGAQEEPIDIYTSEATAIVEAIDIENQKIEMYLTDRNESRVFAYTGATVVQDKYGSPLSMPQLAAGDVVEIKYNKELEKVGELSISSDAWSYEGVTKYNLNMGNGSTSIGDEIYSVGASTKIYSDGKAIDVSQIIKNDVLTFRGKGHSIMSITVDNGHGYLDLVNDEAVLGGWIEVGQTVITQIAQDMLLVIPEGNYTIRLSAAGVEETREVTIVRNKETKLDLGDIEVPKDLSGVVMVTVTPKDAVVYIDEVKVGTTYPIRVASGIHQITATATGYDTLSQYFEVEEAGNTTVSLDLEQTSSVSGNSISKNDETSESTITLKTPVDVEVYQDNLYKGIAPVTYVKTAGSHTITLRKEGYITRSYQIEVADDDENVIYSFPDLDPENDENGTSGSTVSGNSVSGNSVSGNSVSGNSVSKDGGTTGSN